MPSTKFKARSTLLLALTLTPITAGAGYYTQHVGPGLSFTDCDNGRSFVSQRVGNMTFHDFDNGDQAITERYGDWSITETQGPASGEQRALSPAQGLYNKLRR